MRFIAIANQKGGVGKTTTAINLSAALGLAGRRCLLIDLDPQGNASTGIGAEAKPHEGAYRLLTDPSRAADQVVPTNASGVDVISSTSDLAEVENHISGPDRHLRLRMAREVIDNRYDYVLVDCPPSVGFFPTNALCACDTVLVPIQCEYFAMQGLAQILSNISLMKRRLNPGLEIEGILLTMHENSAFAAEVVSEVKNHFSDLVYATKVPRDTALAEAPSHGQTIVEYDHRSRGARAYMELAKEIEQNGKG